jgi:hypothetical protein
MAIGCYAREKGAVASARRPYLGGTWELVKEVSKTVAKAFRNWKITDLVRQYVDENNI